jgi:hypothetical protein
MSKIDLTNRDDKEMRRSIVAADVDLDYFAAD